MPSKRSALHKAAERELFYLFFFYIILSFYYIDFKPMFYQLPLSLLNIKKRTLQKHIAYLQALSASSCAACVFIYMPMPVPHLSAPPCSCLSPRWYLVQPQFLCAFKYVNKAPLQLLQQLCAARKQVAQS